MTASRPNVTEAHWGTPKMRDFVSRTHIYSLPSRKILRQSVSPSLRWAPPTLYLWPNRQRDTQITACLYQTKRRVCRQRLWQTAHSSSSPMSSDRSQSLHAGWPPVYSSIGLYEVLLKSVKWFYRCEWLKIAFSHYFGHWFIYNSLYYRISRDWGHIWRINFFTID